MVAVRVGVVAGEAADGEAAGIRLGNQVHSAGPELVGLLLLDAGELKWWFRSAAPPSALFLMRSLHGLATHLRSLDARLSWRWILDEVAGDLYREVRELSIPALVPANGSGAVTFSGLSRYLKVHVEKGNGNRVSLTMPARVVDSLEEVIDPPVLESIKKNEIDLDEVKAKVQKSGYAPQTLFEVQDPERMVQVWLE